MKNAALLFFFFFFSFIMKAQNVAINENGNAPSNSAILDVSSTDKGVLVPRMSTSQREMISNKATGLLVYDLNSSSFWFYNGSNWINLSGAAEISDADDDTKIQVEEIADEDMIRFDVGGSEIAKLDSKSFQLNGPGESVFIGLLAGEQDNGSGGANTAVGRDAMKKNQSGSHNTVMGSSVLQNNVSGSDNVAIGSGAGANDIQSNRNVYIGTRAGNKPFTAHSKEGSVMIGYEAGSQDTESNKLYIENSNSSAPLIYGDFDKDSLVVHGSLGIKGAYTFPESDGLADQVMSTDGNGKLIWNTKSSTASTLVDDDADTQIAFFEGIQDTIGLRVDNNRGLQIYRNSAGNTIFQTQLHKYNTLFGFNAGKDIGTSGGFPDGYYNTAFGANALRKEDSGAFNTAIGVHALASDTSGMVNTAIGYFSQSSVKDVFGNTTIGSGSLRNAIEGDNNVALGYQTLLEQTTGSENVVIGAQSAEYQSSGDSSVYIGFESGKGGVNPLLDLHSKSRNIFIGHQAGKFEHGSNKLIIENSDSSTPLIYGEFDQDMVRINGELNISNEYTFPVVDGNVNQVLKSDGSGNLSWQDDLDDNATNELVTSMTLVGSELQLNDAGGTKTVDLSMLPTGNEILDDDEDSGISLVEASTDQIVMTLDGSNALTIRKSNDVYDRFQPSVNGGNTCFGFSSGSSLGANATLPQSNTAFGFSALSSHRNGIYNTAIGAESMSNDTGSIYNTAIGYQSLKSNQGDANTVAGCFALKSANGFFNTVSGFRSFLNMTSGQKNTAIGAESGAYQTGGNSSVYIGYEAGSGGDPLSHTLHTKSGNVFIGYQAGKDELNSNRLIIENSDSSTPLIYGEFDNDIVIVNGTLRVSELVRLKPLTTVPGCSTAADEGLIYFDDSAQKLRVCTSSGWVNLH